MAPGFIDGFFMTLLGIGYLPTVNVWAMSYLLGPGIMLVAVSLLQKTPAQARYPLSHAITTCLANQQRLQPIFVLVPILIGIAMYFLIPRERWSAQGDSIAIVSVLRSSVARSSYIVGISRFTFNFRLDRRSSIKWLTWFWIFEVRRTSADRGRSFAAIAVCGPFGATYSNYSADRHVTSALLVQSRSNYKIDLTSGEFSCSCIGIGHRHTFCRPSKSSRCKLAFRSLDSFLMLRFQHVSAPGN
jgi:hypothetical protein